MTSESPFEPPQSETSIVIPEYELAGLNTQQSGPQPNRVIEIASWMVILMVVGLIASLVSYTQFFRGKNYEMSATELIGINMTAKTVVGFRPSGDEAALDQIESFATGPLEQRLGHAILVNEIEGADSALEQMALIDIAIGEEKNRQSQANESTSFPSPEQERLKAVIHQLLQNYADDDFKAANVPVEDREFVKAKLGWVGALAVTPADSPDQTTRQQLESEGKTAFVLTILVFIAGLGALLASAVSVFILAGLLTAGQINSSFPDDGKHGFVYVETFAIWMVLFLGLQIAIELMAELLGKGHLSIVFSPLAFFGSLLALMWPLFRGIPFATLRKDIGWELRNPLTETAVGGFSYLALMVPMVLGIAVTVLLSTALMSAPSGFESAGPAGHPIADEIASGNLLVCIFVIVSACIAAPIVEETMFRGVLYRYLREATGRYARWFSVIVSAVVGGLIFALIHPQGLVGVPALTTLAIGFSLVREWRNSLVGPMVMHGINNGIITCMLLWLVS